MAISIINPPPNRGLQDILGIVNTINDFRRISIQKDEERNQRAALLKQLGEAEESRELFGIKRRLEAPKTEEEPGLMASLFGKKVEPEIEIQPSEPYKGTISALPTEQFEKLRDIGAEKIFEPITGKEPEVVKLKEQLAETTGQRITPEAQKLQARYDAYISKKGYEKHRYAKGMLKTIDDYESRALQKQQGLAPVIPARIKTPKEQRAYLGIPIDPNEIAGDNPYDKITNLKKIVDKQVRGMSLGAQYELRMRQLEVTQHIDKIANTDFAKGIFDQLAYLRARMKPAEGKGKENFHFTDPKTGEDITIEGASISDVRKRFNLPLNVVVNPIGKVLPTTLAENKRKFIEKFETASSEGKESLIGEAESRGFKVIRKPKTGLASITSMLNPFGEGTEIKLIDKRTGENVSTQIIEKQGHLKY